MDSFITAAMQKWPAVPHCYGWLSFDRRGEWRIKNQNAQQFKLLVELIHHQGFKEYIEAHLAHDGKGNYFFQNGPQRVFIHFSYCPWVLRFYPLEEGQWQIRTTFGEVIQPLACLLDEHGQIIFEADFTTRVVNDEGVFLPRRVRSIGLLHDHDLEIFSAFAKVFQNHCGSLGEFLWHEKLSIEPIHSKDLPSLYHFYRNPQA